MTLNDYLHLHARQQPDKIAAIDHAPTTFSVGRGSATEDGGALSSTLRTITYSQLSQQVKERSKAYSKGLLVPFQTTQDIDFLITYFAIHEAGAVAIPMPSDFSVARGSATAIECPTPSPEISDILFTTGTTGQQKGVMISHQAIIADAENLIEGLHFTPDLTFIICGPLNHIGSLSKIWPVILQGATLHILEGMKDLNAFFDAFRSDSVLGTGPFATFLVPATTRMLLQFAADRLAACADKIDFIESGAAALPHSDMLKLCELLPHTHLYNTYASTETGIISTYNFNDGQCIPGCLGSPMSHSTITITPDGHVACQGDTIMSGYLDNNRPTPNTPLGSAACSPKGSQELSIIETSDLGYLDEEGRLHLTGRSGDVINVGGFKVAPTEVEEACMSAPDVKDCVCIAVPHPITGQALKLLVVMKEDTMLDKRSLARHLSTLLEPHKVPMLYEQVDKIARTYNGKIDRKAYK